MDLSELLPIPDLLAAQHLLCVMPHPDDNEIGAGGTVARLTAAGVRVTYLCVTDGRRGTLDPALEPGQVAATRRAELTAAAAHLGVQAVEWLDYPDAEDLPAGELRRQIIGLVRRLRPDFLLTVDPWLPYEAHPDHRATGLAVAEACLFASFPTFYPEQLEVDGLTPHAVKGVAFYATTAPNTYIDIDATWERKLQSLRMHASQFPDPYWESLAAYLDAKARELAAKAGCGCNRAEAFKVLTPMHLHMNVDTVQL